MNFFGLLILFFYSTVYLSAQSLYRFDKNGKYGFKNASGQIIVKPIYDDASDSVTSLGGVLNKDRLAVINNTGELVTGFTYTGGVGKFLRSKVSCCDPKLENALQLLSSSLLLTIVIVFCSV